MCWLRVADDSFPASNFSSSWNMGSVHGGELAALQVDVRKFLARKPGWSRFVSMNFWKKPLFTLIVFTSHWLLFCIFFSCLPNLQININMHSSLILIFAR